MDYFKILGISPTKEEDEIKQAYFERLKSCNPEEDPNGFMELRRALEEALNSLKEPEMMGSPEAQALTKKMMEIYGDFSARIDGGSWQELLKLPVCQELDQEEEASCAVLAFIMDHYRIPHAIMKLLAEHFNWADRKEELEEKFPEGFVGFVLNHAEYDDPIDYYAFPIEEEFDYDSYIGTFYQLGRAINEQEEEMAKEQYEKMKEYKIEHPDTLEQMVRYHLYILKDYEKAWELSGELLEKYGRGGTRLLAYGRSGLAAEKMEEIAPIMEELREEGSENALKLYGDYLFHQENYEDALKYFLKAREKAEEEWQALEEAICSVYRKLSERYEKELEEHPSEELRWKTAESLYKGREFEKARAILEQIGNQEGKELVYYKWLADSCQEMRDYEHSVQYREQLKDYIETMEDPKRYFWDMGCDYINLERYEEALQNFAEGARRDPESWIWPFKKAEVLYYQDLDDESLELCERIMDDWGFISQVFNLKIKNLFDKRDYDAVISHAEHVINQGYRSAIVYFNYASSLRRKERYEDAIKYLNILSEENGEDGVVCEEMARVYYDKKNYEEALSWVEKALEYGMTRERQYLKAYTLSELSRYEEERDIYQEIIDQGDGYYHTHYRLAYALEELKDYEKAEEHYRISLKEKPDNYWARCSFADVLQKQRRWEEAVEEYKRSMENPAHHKWCVWNLCRLLRRMRRLDEALTYVKLGIEKFPKESCLYLTAARICYSKKDYHQSISYFLQYGEMKEKDLPFCWRNIGDAYADNKEYEKAEEAYKKAIEIDETDDTSWRFLGVYYMSERKDPEKALPYFLKAVELDEKFDGNLRQLGKAYEKLGELQKARECFEKALIVSKADVESDPESACNYESLADLYFRVGDYEAAIETAEKAFLYDSCYFNCPYCGCQEAYEIIAWSRAKLGQKEEALECIHKAKSLDSELRDETEELYKELTGATDGKEGKS